MKTIMWIFLIAENNLKQRTKYYPVKKLIRKVNKVYIILYAFRRIVTTIKVSVLNVTKVQFILFKNLRIHKKMLIEPT